MTLTERQMAVLQCLASGVTAYDDIAGALGISRSAVAKAVQGMFVKFNVRTSEHVVRAARREGLLPLGLTGARSCAMRGV